MAEARGEVGGERKGWRGGNEVIWIVERSGGGEGSGPARVGSARVERERLHWVGSTDGLMYGWMN